MNGPKSKKLFGLSPHDKEALINRIKARKGGKASISSRPTPSSSGSIPDEMVQFKSMPGIKKLHLHRTVASKLGIMSPYFLCHDKVAKDVAVIGGKEYLNFSTYDYLNINGCPELTEAARQAMEIFGTSASASRLVAGERPPHRQLEAALAQLYQTDDCVVFVSGHATNVWTLFQLFSQNDLILFDSLAHNSVIQGAHFSGAHRLVFPHNNLERLEKLLSEQRANYQRAIIVTEGLYSMDGDMPDLPGLIELKQRYKCFIMVDEAHSLGVLGRTGKGVAEEYDLDPSLVDIWMGTLSKTLCGCGGYIAGSSELVEYLKFTAPGFVYSVGMSPPLAAASLAAMNIFRNSPERVEHLQSLGRFFVEYAGEKGLDTGLSQGYAIVPIIVGSSLLAGLLATHMFDRGVNVLPIIYPVVEEKAARLRFFLSAAHSREQIRTAIDICAEELPKAMAKVTAFTSNGEGSADGGGKPNALSRS